MPTPCFLAADGVVQCALRHRSWTLTNSYKCEYVFWSAPAGDVKCCVRTSPLVAGRTCWNAATAETSAAKEKAPARRVFRRARLDAILLLLLERLQVFVENVVPARREASTYDVGWQSPRTSGFCFAKINWTHQVYFTCCDAEYIPGVGEIKKRFVAVVCGRKKDPGQLRDFREWIASSTTNLTNFRHT